MKMGGAPGLPELRVEKPASSTPPCSAAETARALSLAAGQPKHSSEPLPAAASHDPLTRGVL